VADRNQDGLKGWRKTLVNWVVEIGWRLPRTSVTTFALGGQGLPRAVEPMMLRIMLTDY
jgi:hypothetical protein